jgi:nucleoside-diphosphate-sugar epimerase
MKRILITGGSGFIGTNLVEFYIAEGFHVLNIDVNPPRNPSHINYWISVDITDRAKLLAAIEGFDPHCCFHLAARTDLAGRDASAYLANTEGVLNVLEALKLCSSIEFAVFASSMLVCKTGYLPKDDNDYCPTTAYGHSKVEGEILVRKHIGNSYKYIIVRPTSIWGPWFSTPYKDFFDAVRKGYYIHPYGRRVHRSYGFVMNSVFQLDQLFKCKGGELVAKSVYICDYKPLELQSWACLIQNISNAPAIKELPYVFFKLLALIGDALKLVKIDFPLTSFRLKNMLTEAVHDSESLRKITGDLPHDVDDGVRLTVSWINRND